MNQGICPLSQSGQGETVRQGIRYHSPALCRPHTNHRVQRVVSQPLLPLLGRIGLGSVSTPSMTMCQVHGIPVEKEAIKLVI